MDGFQVAGYSSDIELKMQRYFMRLSEKDQRGYAAVEAAKQGHGGIEYVSRLFSIDPKTVRRGLAELEMADDPLPGRDRKKRAASKVLPLTINGGIQLAQNDKGPMGLASGL